MRVVDALDDYVAQLEECFDFEKLRNFIRKKPALLFDAMHGAAGPAALRVMCQELGVPKSQLYRCDPRPDFGGCHPDPNLKWASELVRRASLNEDGSPGDSLGEALALGVAFDGDGDRNMIVVRPRRPVVWRRLHAIFMNRLPERRSWVVSFSILSRATATPRAGPPLLRVAVRFLGRAGGAGFFY